MGILFVLVGLLAFTALMIRKTAQESGDRPLVYHSTFGATLGRLLDSAGPLLGLLVVLYGVVSL